MAIRSPRECAQLYEDRTYKTYLSRVQQHKRLLRTRDNVRWSSIAFDFLCVLSIVLPAVVPSFWWTPQDDTGLYVLVATLITAISVCWGQVQEFLNLDIRAHKIHQGYILIQALSRKFELLKDKQGLKMSELEPLITEYTHLLLASENHESRDFLKSVKG